MYFLQFQQSPWPIFSSFDKLGHDDIVLKNHETLYAEVRRLGENFFKVQIRWRTWVLDGCIGAKGQVSFLEPPEKHTKAASRTTSS